MKRKTALKIYSAILENSGLLPNFWCSEEYWKLGGWTAYCENGCYWLEEDGKHVLPTFRRDGSLREEECWADFPYTEAPKGLQKEFLDYNYWYRASDFQTMEGSKWAVFRKNCRKWPRRNPDHEWIRGPYFVSPLLALVERWAEKHETVHDDDLLWAYMNRAHNNCFLKYEGRIVAWMSWDHNFRATNFRWLIIEPGQPFLDEYCRWYFYNHLVPPQSMVNDGGVLDSAGLEKMKDKLNPAFKFPIYSWRKPCSDLK
jgi:hypothetical protein